MEKWKESTEWKPNRKSFAVRRKNSGENDNDNARRGRGTYKRKDGDHVTDAAVPCHSKIWQVRSALLRSGKCGKSLQHQDLKIVHWQKSPISTLFLRPHSLLSFLILTVLPQVVTTLFNNDRYHGLFVLKQQVQRHAKLSDKKTENLGRELANKTETSLAADKNWQQNKENHKDKQNENKYDPQKKATI